MARRYGPRRVAASAASRSAVRSASASRPSASCDLDQQGQQRRDRDRLADRGHLVVRAGGGPLQQVGGQRGLAPGQVQRGQRADRVRVLVEAAQQLGRVLQPALPEPQVGQPDDRGLPAGGHAAVELPGRGQQLGLCLVPAAGGGEDAAVVGPAERGDDRAALHPAGDGPHPLVRPGDVVDQLAGPEEAAEHRVDGGKVAHLAGAGRGHRLVEVHQALLDPVGEDHQPAEVAERLELDVRVAAAPAGRDRLAQQGFPGRRVRLAERAEDQQPALLRAVRAGVGELCAGPGQPAALHRPLAEHAAADPAEGSGHATGVTGPPGPPVRRVRLLEAGRRGLVLAAEVRGPPPPARGPARRRPTRSRPDGGTG